MNYIAYDYKPWPYCVDMDDEIRDAMPSYYVKYGVFIKDRETCEFFIHLNGEKWRK